MDIVLLLSLCDWTPIRNTNTMVKCPDDARNQCQTKQPNTFALIVHWCNDNDALHLIWCLFLPVNNSVYSHFRLWQTPPSHPLHSSIQHNVIFPISQSQVLLSWHSKSRPWVANSSGALRLRKFILPLSLTMVKYFESTLCSPKFCISGVSMLQQSTYCCRPLVDFFSRAAPVQAQTG